jgi:acyl-CoA thioesterase
VTALAEVIAAAEPVAGGFRTGVPASWMQGRTAYGGFSAALALEAALRLEPDLPPLRSAQIAFIGPLAGEVSVTATRLRRGRNAAFLQADVVSVAGLGLRATWVFMAAMASKVARDTAPRAPVAPPAAGAKLYTGPAEFFTGHFEFLDIRDGTGEAEWLRWARLRERAGLHPMVELIAVGDGLPPAAFKLFGERNIPLSSLNWSINLLTPEPAAEGGWWLLGAVTDAARDGFSSQRMTIWNAAGTPVAEASQAVAIFA